MAAGRRIHRQGQIGEDFRQKKPGASITIKNHGVFANPANAGFFRKGTLQYRGAVDKDTITEVTNFLFYLAGEYLQAFADQFVIVTAKGVAGDVGLAFSVQLFNELQP